MYGTEWKILKVLIFNQCFAFKKYTVIIEYNTYIVLKFWYFNNSKSITHNYLKQWRISYQIIYLILCHLINWLNIYEW